LIGLSVIALVLADQYVTVALNRPEFNVQWFFRILTLVIVAVVGFFALNRRRAADPVVGPAA
ncbi:MAG: hypothetical protein M3Q71_05395, partial [Chloroflexota bacterium]|nr:hypothetical protein [Chloroflexota bacterium]